MMKRYISILPGILAMLFAISSCVYPFEPQYSAADNRMVIEGDILIGEVSHIKVSFVRSISDFNGAQTYLPQTEIQIESEDGRKYPEKPVIGAECDIDLRNAPDNVRYRLCVHDLGNGHHYNSAWAEVTKPATIDKLSHHSIDKGPDGSVAIALSMHSNDESQHFRWSYTETYEYHSQFLAKYYYEPPVRDTWTWNNGYGVVVEFQPGENHYYCWKTAESSEILLFSTDTQNENRFEDLEFHVIPKTSVMLQEVYYIKVYLQALDDDAYRFWKSMYDNTYQQGNLFSPTPSSMRGNITCEENPDEMVLGFISASRRAVKDMYIDNLDTFYYVYLRNPNEIYSDAPIEIPMADWHRKYNGGWSPYLKEIDDNFREYISWIPTWCVDCRVSGGTKNKPAGWPRAEK